ncbi:VIR protein [Plasmodium vivax]|uniref:VIR protein n=1 Tax=Plasmodium vivax TaxID=5855 RepID=A0A1G4H9C9_PLAVI|nr:VIR protein [Plasmodium vivax]
MAESVDKFILDEFVEKKDILESSDLHKFYNNLKKYWDNKDTTSANCTDKKDLKICYLGKTLENIVSDWNSICSLSDKNNDKCCCYLTYWLYGEIAKISPSYFRINDIYNMADKFFKKINCPSSTNEICTKNYVKIFNTKVLENKKVLYDFAEYYDHLKNLLNEAHSDNKDEHCEYIKKFFQLYRIMQLHQHFKLTKHYCLEIKHFKDKFKDDVLSQLEEACPGKGIKSLFNADIVTEHPSGEQFKNTIEKVVKPLTNKAEIEKSILKDLPSNTIYEEFNKTGDLDDYKEGCKKTFKPENGKDKDDITDFCEKFTRNMKKKVYITENDGKNQQNGCSYFTHWTYQNILKIFTTLDNTKKYTVIEELNKIMHKINTSDLEGKPCSFYFDGTPSQWEEEKYLHDYFKNHESIKAKYNSNVSEKKMFCEYLSYIYKLYGKYIWKCCTYFYRGNSWNLCPKHFECDRKYNPFKLLSTLKCENEIISESEENAYDTLMIDREVVLKSQIIPCNSLICDPFYKFAMVPLAFLGLSSVFFLFYKFTPFGTQFHKKKLKEKGNNRNIPGRGKGKPLPNKVVRTRSNAQNGRIRIAYSSS